MTKDELYENAQYLDVADMMTLFECGRDKAKAIIRLIKEVSDIANIKGKVTISDYFKWYSGKKNDWLSLQNLYSTDGL